MIDHHAVETTVVVSTAANPMMVKEKNSKMEKEVLPMEREVLPVERGEREVLPMEREEREVLPMERGEREALLVT